MDELLKDWLGTIAVIVYLVYPLIKRWLDRRKQRSRTRAETGAAKQSEPAQDEVRAPPKATRPRRAPQRAQDLPSAAPPAPEAPPAPGPDPLTVARARATRLIEQASTLLSRAEADPKWIRLVPALRHDVLERAREVEASLAGNPTISTIMQTTTVMRGLEALTGTLEAIAAQRSRASASLLADADRMANACYAPMVEHARAQGLDLGTRTPVAVTGGWPVAIAPGLASTRVAPVRLPRGFAQSVFVWPAIAHEVAQDVYFGVRGLRRGLHDRLGLPMEVAAPTDEREVDEAWLRGLFGAWLSEVFADTLGTLMLGPAYVEAMRRRFRNPDAAHRTSAVFAPQGMIDEQPPARLRLYMAARVLHHLGRHEEADALWARWQEEHPETDFYLLPLAGRWAGVSDESMHRLADGIIDALLEEPWPELEGFALTDIPGLPYLHADHAEVERAINALVRGERVEADVRWIMAAAVLAAADQPTLHGVIRDAARRSIAGVEVDEAPQAAVAPASAPRDVRDLRGAILGSLRRPTELREAILVGEAIRPYRGMRGPHPRSHV